MGTSGNVTSCDSASSPLLRPDSSVGELAEEVSGECAGEKANAADDADDDEEGCAVVMT